MAATCIGGYLSGGAAQARSTTGTTATSTPRWPAPPIGPVPSGRVSPRAALAYGLLLCAASFAWLTTTVNVLAAVLAFSGFVGYTVMYTAWLKRRTPQNIVIGGAAGAVPPLVGWAAVAGHVTRPPGTCSRSSSTGRRRTSGPCRC